MKKKLSKADFEICQKYEREFLCAESDYLRTPGREGVKALRGVYAHIFGSEYQGSDSCGHCELTMMQAILPSYRYTQELNKKK